MVVVSDDGVVLDLSCDEDVASYCDLGVGEFVKVLKFQVGCPCSVGVVL